MARRHKPDERSDSAAVFPGVELFSTERAEEMSADRIATALNTLRLVALEPAPRDYAATGSGAAADIAEGLAGDVLRDEAKCRITLADTPVRVLYLLSVSRTSEFRELVYVTTRISPLQGKGSISYGAVVRRTAPDRWEVWSDYEQPPTNLDYEAPEPPPPGSERGAKARAAFLAVVGLAIIYVGAFYIREWRQARQVSVTGNESDIWLGLFACTIGGALIVLSVFIWRRL